jgi:hypothetical protein
LLFFIRISIFLSIKWPIKISFIKNLKSFCLPHVTVSQSTNYSYIQKIKTTLSIYTNVKNKNQNTNEARKICRSCKLKNANECDENVNIKRKFSLFSTFRTVCISYSFVVWKQHNILNWTNTDDFLKIMSFYWLILNFFFIQIN